MSWDLPLAAVCEWLYVDLFMDSIGVNLLDVSRGQEGRNELTHGIVYWISCRCFVEPVGISYH